jgi:hypothetical protein
LADKDINVLIIKVVENKEIYGMDDVIKLRRELNPSKSKLAALFCLRLNLRGSI